MDTLTFKYYIGYATDGRKIWRIATGRDIVESLQDDRFDNWLVSCFLVEEIQDGAKFKEITESDATTRIANWRHNALQPA